ncbi:peptide chain release factor N(5)-glutamine methyltransferase [Mesonia aestuariivivens]|uniref:Release factor glutamine methyltransferase n=1 Tax=Mesonia aestuariivivens TaxID=2796128 RepID=A0ABS6W025_9FLAO|nr:peptide chain release factor N(5)-glutamine methyltransferase [Mesonia aestuariivivens]MBW2961201.1 peptide chain release factor N(5)-glutamine methyltransferase [Mesonia aestuariivivens]
MKIKKYKTEFFAKLLPLFPETEVESFFYLLTEAYLDKTRIQLALDPNFEIKPEHYQQFEKALARLIQQEPIQYILGDTEFFGYPFQVNQHTLIPRPETEELVAWIIEDCKFNIQHSIFSILDIGTGSGCIPISLAKELPQAKLSAIDVSVEALKVAQLNASLNKVTVNFIQQDILKAENLSGKYDVIVSNPPYVREQEKEFMHKNVLEFEPELALFVENENPLIFYRKIAQLAKTALTENGILYFEINEYLAEELKSMLKEFDCREIELKKDIFGKFRMCKASF